MKKVTRERETVAIFSQAATAVAATPPVKAGPQRPFQSALPADPDSVILLVDQIEVRRQVREHFDEEALRELAADIDANGQLQPIVVSPLNGGRFLLDAGERRFRAIRLLGRDQIRATIRRSAGDEEACTRVLVQLAENDQRQDLTKIEVARAIVRLQKETGWSDEEVAERMHHSRSWVVQVRAVLSAPPSLQRAISVGAVSWHTWTHDKDALKTLAAVLPADIEPEAFAAAYDARHPLVSDDEVVTETGKKTPAAKSDDDPKAPSISLSVSDAKALLKTLQKVAAKHRIKFDDVPKDLSRKDLAALLVSIHRKIGRAL